METTETPEKKSKGGVPATAGDALKVKKTQALLQCRDGDTGIISAQSIVEAARDPSHVLHDDFEWDDSKAGEAFRLVQAEGLIRRYKITVIREDRESKKVKVMVTRGAVSRPSLRGKDGGYEMLEDVLKDPVKREEMLGQALKELDAMRKKYDVLEELAVVWEALEELAAG